MQQGLEALTPESSAIVLSEFAINLLITFGLATILERVYSRWGSSLSNRRRFGANFTLLALTTMIIITVVKSSLALSLGLVGALSIVRFRAAIKEPEELCFLFITIAVGLGLGAGQRAVTLIGFGFVLAAIRFRHPISGRGRQPSTMYLTVSRFQAGALPVEDIVGVLRDHCRLVDLKRLDESAGSSEAVFIIDFKGVESLEHARRDLRALDPSLSVSLLDQGVLGAA